MPRVDIPLGGWQQVPDERTGQPRIARLSNCRVENQGRITKSPGQAALPTTSDGNAITKPLTVGPDFVIFQDSGATLQPGFRIGKLLGTAWAQYSGASDFVSSVEAPRLKEIFSEESSHYLHCGVLDCGNGDLVIYAEKAPNWLGSTDTDDLDIYGRTTIVWELLSGSSGLEPVKFGELTIGIDSLYCYPTSTATYLVAWYNAYLLIWKWNNTTQTFDVVTSGTTLAGPGRLGDERSQLDVCYSPQIDRLFVAGPDGTVLMLNGTTGALVYFGDYAPFVTGAFGIMCVDSAWVYSGDPMPVLVMTYQTSATTWGAQILKIVPSGFFGSTPSTLLYTSPATILNLVTNQAAKRPSICYGGGSYYAVLPAKGVTASTTESDCVVATFTYNAGSDTLTVTAVSELIHHRLAATKVVWDAYNGPVWWAYDAFPARSLRICELVGLGSNVANVYHGKTLALVGGNPGVAPMPHYQEPAGPMVRSVNLPPVLLGNTDKRIGWVGALMVQKNATSRLCSVYLATVVDAFTDTNGVGSLFNRPDVGQVARMRGVTYVACGLPSAYATVPDVGGFYAPPPKARFVVTAGSGIPNGETHNVVSCYRYENRAGQVIYGPVSDVATYTNSTGGAVNVDAVFEAEVEGNNDWRVTLYIYQSINGVFHLVNGPRGYAVPPVPHSLHSAAFLVTYFSAQPILYTQGANGALSGQLDHFGPPPCRTIWTGRNRVICGGLANERQVHWSTIAFPTEALAWPQDATFKAEVDEPVTAVAALDDYWFIFSERSIWVVTGEGPDNLGNGTFEDPLRVSTGLGCVSWRSVVETPLGLMFQGNNGQIYLIARGTTSPTMASQAIRDSLTSNARYDADFHEQWIIGAVYDSLAQEVWFSTHYRDWVLQLETLAWREELHPLSYCRGASFFESRSIGSCGYAGPVVIRDAKMHRLRRHDTDSYVYLDVNGAERQFSIETSDIDLGYRGRIRRGWLRVVRDRNAPTLRESWNAKLWYDGKSREQTQNESVTLAGSDSPSLDAYAFADLEFCPARQKCNQVRIKITGGDGVTAGGVLWDVLGLAVDIAPSKDSPVKTTQGSGRLK